MKKIIRYLLSGIVACCFFGILAACKPQEGEKKEPELPRLATPSDFVLSYDNVLNWGEVENSLGYKVEIDGTEFEIPKSYYVFGEFTDGQTVALRVQAIGDGSVYANSEWAEYVYTYEAPTPALSYTLLEDGSGYEVRRKNSNPNTGLEGRVVIPDYYNRLPVTRIAEKAFMVDSLSRNPNTVTTSFRLPAYLTSIGKYAFCCCSALEEVQIPDRESISDLHPAISC